MIGTYDKVIIITFREKRKETSMYKRIFNQFSNKLKLTGFTAGGTMIRINLKGRLTITEQQEKLLNEKKALNLKVQDLHRQIDTITPKRTLLVSYVDQNQRIDNELRFIRMREEIIERVTSEIFNHRLYGIPYSSSFWDMKNSPESDFFNEAKSFLEAYGLKFDPSMCTFTYPVALKEPDNFDELTKNFSTSKEFWVLFDEKLKNAFATSEKDNLKILPGPRSNL